ncbi:MAG: hypothetical protein CL489_05965 [Acidobacteria bacterium]|nr:hypothetical protein [Acidobacteriota bacterium]
MILIDFSQTIIAGLMAQLKSTGGEMNEKLLRHMILNTLRNYQKRYSAEYGKMVLCTDAIHPWRRDFFPQYKANRKKTRDKDDKDWGMIFNTLHKVKDEIEEHFPYHVLHVKGCEGDDLIAVLVMNTTSPTLIVSGDKDFQQLHKYNYVDQWSPNLNKMIQCDDPEKFLKEHILKGDKTDGVPNVLSNDNCLDEGIRQTPLRRPILEKYLRISIEKDDKYYRNYVRNQTLIDFANIPQELVDRILKVYDTTHPTHKAEKVFDYLRVNKLDMLLEHIEDFRL